ncbi:hypothetical protein [Streptomyces sp. NPDC007346]|uniref:hypothetical protein n=1 Tax=Streptomyces sp. NPDC007346 TaxID=3154682 RepID=UPI0034520E91
MTTQPERTPLDDPTRRAHLMEAADAITRLQDQMDEEIRTEYGELDRDTEVEGAATRRMADMLRELAEHIVRPGSPQTCPVSQDSHDYDVISYIEGATEWGLDDVGLSRDEAVAAMLLRAFRWGDWDAVPFIKAITTGAHDPEEPYWVNDAFTAAERRAECHPACFRIVRSNDDGKPAPPPIPAPDAFGQFEARKVEEGEL